MSMTVCLDCSRFVDSDDDPDCFLLLGGKDVVLCETCREERARELEEDEP